MIINLRNLPDGHSTANEQVVFAEEQSAHLNFDGPVECTADIVALQWQIHVALSFKCTIKLECARCLKDISHEMQGDFSIIIQNKDAPDSETDEEEADFYFSGDDVEVDTRPALYDEIMTAIPMMPLCSPECTGIKIPTQAPASSTRGKPPAESDPRWEALKKIKEKKN